MIDFLILYEHKARELENDCLIKAELEKRGYKVELINVYEYKKIKYLTYQKPKVILVPYLYDNKDMNDNIYSRVGKIKKIINLQWEQVLSRKEINRGFHDPKENSVYATHICWGKECKRRLNKAGVRNAILTGPIQMDFLKDNFKVYYKSKDQLMKEFRLNKDNKLILYISSFTLTNMTKNEIKAIENRVSDSYKELQNIMTISKYETLNWIEKLLSKRKDINFIYRPHPDERNDKSLNYLQKKYSNFKVIDDYSVKQWILISDKIFTWISTSIAEVFFAKKNCSILRPVEIPEDLDSEIDINAEFINKYEQMLELFDDNSTLFPIECDIIKKHYLVNDRPTYIRICNLLEKVLKTDKYDIKESFKLNLYEIFWNVIMDEVIMRLNLKNKSYKISNEKLKNRINSIHNAYEHFKKDMVTKKEMDRIVYKIKEIIK